MRIGNRNYDYSVSAKVDKLGRITISNAERRIIGVERNAQIIIAADIENNTLTIINPDLHICNECKRKL